MNKGILILTPFFSPNIGGVESHLDDLTSLLDKLRYKVFVQTYSPLTTRVEYKRKEHRGKNIEITRYPWPGYNLFHKLENYPILNFLYITTFLACQTLIWMIKNHQKIDTIHSHGFNAAFIGNLLSKVFNKKHINSTHAIYENIGKVTQKLILIILTKADHILCLSNGSLNQLRSWGVPKQKLSTYTHWINLDKFKPATNIQSKFTILFVGRLIPKKGTRLLLKLASKFPKFQFLVVGSGPDETLFKSSKLKNLKYLGQISNSKMDLIYKKSSLLVVPSQYPEGYGRVVMEAVASGLPILSSNLGALPEALDDSVAYLTQPTLSNFSKGLKYLTKTKNYQRLRSNCRPYAIKKFSQKNIKYITQHYKKN